MEVTTPVGDPATNARVLTPADVTGRHGDVDKNGDLVDQSGTVLGDELDAVLRIRAAITAATPAAEEAQLRAVVRMLRRRGLDDEVPS